MFCKTFNFSNCCKVCMQTNELALAIWYHHYKWKRKVLYFSFLLFCFKSSTFVFDCFWQAMHSNKFVLRKVIIILFVSIQTFPSCDYIWQKIMKVSIGHFFGKCLWLFLFFCICLNGKLVGLQYLLYWRVGE